MKVNWKDDFGKEYQVRGQQKYGLRLLALWKIQKGCTEREVCRLLSKTPNTIRKWRKHYEQGGLERLLKIGEGRGRKALCSKREILEKGIAELEQERSGGRIRCKEVVDYLRTQYQIDYTCSGMYKVLHRLGFSWITSRSRHPKQDPSILEAFKKTSARKCKK